MEKKDKHDAGDYPPRPPLSRQFIAHANLPEDFGGLEVPDGSAKGVGSCGDSKGEYDPDEGGRKKMPIYEILCQKCRTQAEVLIARQGDQLLCPNCGSDETSKLMSATSSRTGKSGQVFPGPKDTACCGSTPAEASCAGPGSCCGKTR